MLCYKFIANPKTIKIKIKINFILHQLFKITKNTYRYHTTIKWIMRKKCTEYQSYSSQFRVKYIKTQAETKMVPHSALHTIRMKSVVSWNLLYSVSRFETEYSAWNYSLWEWWLDMLIYPNPLPCLLLIIRYLQRPQAFAILWWLYRPLSTW